MKSVCPWDESSRNTEWRSVQRPNYNNGQLLAAAQSIPQLVNYYPGEQPPLASRPETCEDIFSPGVGVGVGVDMGVAAIGGSGKSQDAPSEKNHQAAAAAPAGVEFVRPVEVPPKAPKRKREHTNKERSGDESDSEMASD